MHLQKRLVRSLNLVPEAGKIGLVRYITNKKLSHILRREYKKFFSVSLFFRFIPYHFKVMATPRKVTYFKASFPRGEYIKVAEAKFDPDLDSYVHCHLNVGWTIASKNSNVKIDGGRVRYYRKACNGFVTCMNEECAFSKKQLRPAIDLKVTIPRQPEKGCKLCGCRLHHDNTCRAYATYTFSGTTCTLVRYGYHNHNQEVSGDGGANDETAKTYLQKHLTMEKQQNWTHVSRPTRT